MKSVVIAPQSTDVTSLLDQARTDDLLVQAPDGSEYVISLVDEFDQEVARTRQQQELLDLLDKRSSSASRKSLDAVKRELGLGS
jgi:hypothetical protein